MAASGELNLFLTSQMALMLLLTRYVEPVEESVGPLTMAALKSDRKIQLCCGLIVLTFGMIIYVNRADIQAIIVMIFGFLGLDFVGKILLGPGKWKNGDTSR